MLNFIVLLGLVALFVPSSHSAHANTPTQMQTVYRSLGEFGEVKYSQFPPPLGTTAIKLQFRADGLQSDSGQLSTDAQAQRAAYQANTPASSTTPPAPSRPTQTQKATKVIAKDPSYQQQCQALQLNLENLSTGGHIYEIDAMGSRTYLTAADVQLKREHTKNLLTQYCRYP